MLCELPYLHIAPGMPVFVDGADSFSPHRTQCRYGLLMAPMQAFSRSLFATLVPRGKETACYSAYELTNRGSSWIGPTVLTVVQQYTGDMRRGFVYVFVAIGVGMVLLTRVDFVRGKRLASAAHPDGSPQPTTDATAAVLSTPQTVDMEMISVQNAPASS